VPAGVLAASDEIVPADVLATRLGWLAAIVQRVAEQRIASVWEARRVTEINEARPGHAYVAMENTYGKGDWPPADLHASDRVRRMVDEMAGRTLRSAARQMTLLTAILPVFLPEGAFAALTSKEQEAQTARLASVPTPHATTGVQMCSAASPRTRAEMSRTMSHRTRSEPVPARRAANAISTSVA